MGFLCGLCEWLVRATCLGGPWLVCNCSRWCAVSLSRVGGSRESGVLIVQMLCRIRASQMGMTSLWCVCWRVRSFRPALRGC